MDEIYRMLGREHEADLEREAIKFRRAAEVRGSRGDSAKAPDAIRVRAVFVGRLLRQRLQVLLAHNLGRASRLHASDFEPRARDRGQS